MSETKVSAVVVNGIELRYTVNNGKASICKMESYLSGAISIPSKIGGFPVVSIGDCAFSGCIGLANVTIPDSVTNIGDGVFSDCDGLESILVSMRNANYKSVNGLLLSDDGKILICGVNGDVVVPDGVVIIGDYAFYGFTGLTSITIPNSVRSIGNGAFEGCSGLRSITIGNGVTRIGEGAFSGCGSLKTILVDSENANYKTVNGLLLSHNGKTLIRGINGDIVVPDGVVSIGDDAFSGCNGLTSITIPDSVKGVEKGAFHDCRGLTSVVICNRDTRVTVTLGVED